jgi:hypothetical protein
MTKDEALRLALESLEYRGTDSWRKRQPAIVAIKAALEANEFNPDLDTQAVLTEEIQRMAKRIEELEAKGEPVAWFWFDERDGGEWIHIADNQINADKFGNAKVIPLYTIPPQRTWVGLTDEEIEQGCKESWVTLQAWQSAVWWAEAKLRSKNDPHR